MAKKTFDIGDRTQSLNITGRNQQLFTDPEDIKWALETHVKWPGSFSPSNTTAIIITGNEDAPDSVWGTTAKGEILITTEFERLA